MDGLAIITGIAIVSFLLLYLAFNLEKEHIFLKILTALAAIFILIFIPQTTMELDRDCAVSDNGTYRCFYGNGSEVSYTNENRNIGNNFYTAMLLYIIILGAYLLVFYSWKVLKYFKFVGDTPKWRKATSRRKL